MENIDLRIDGDFGQVKPAATSAIGRVRPRVFEQLGIIINDGSSSMNGLGNGNLTKAQSVNIATRELMGRMKASREAPNYSLAVISFDHQASVVLPPTQVGPDLDDNANFDPTNNHGGGTAIFEGILKGDALGSQFLSEGASGGVRRNCVYVLLTDGCCNEPDKTREAARRIKERDGGRITIAAALFRTLADRENTSEDHGAALLREIVTDPVMGFKTVYDAESLRNFFIASQSVGRNCE